MQSTPAGTIVIENALDRYGEQVRAALADLGTAGGSALEFGPGYQLPPAADLTRFFAASELAFADLGSYRGKKLTMLDLMRNPRTRTTKTCASLVIVARALDHIRRTGERAIILSPSSGNKATALRDAVLRAYETGLASPGQLGVIVVVPALSKHKLWDSPLSSDEMLRSCNPVVTFDGAEPADVKPLARALVDGHSYRLRAEHGVNLWYTLDINNYKVADVVRACAEQEFLPRTGGRLHVHAVSSAFGLIGHNLGAQRLAAAGGPEPDAHYFLVQHLATADMVLSLYFDSPSRDNIPAYRLDAATGLYRQDENPRFPLVTFGPDENLDPTFYTRRPPTSAEINPIIRNRGGGGMVVSLYEVLTRYPQLRGMLGPAGVVLPEDPRNLREWSLVMALTGILNAIDRGLVEEDDILVHGSGSYQAADFEPIPAPYLTPVTGVDELAEVAETAVRAAESGRALASSR
ncbi:hypothetical protein JOF56_006792 [Kibdelosporangium banguiense]|uniref:Uncharacterized protein n=1 Tax=Kibdelosporangium banguiense TaxID=1365924 RepID=A0ABS4TPS9_9PSEU|nr:DUF6002 family protein [Kibdelosporangium banguiense]MBP2326407.1 hypothetical protein [Kibdelosporangium banguiense]